MLTVIWSQTTTRHCEYRKAFYISRKLVVNNIVDNPYVFGASPVGAASTTS